SSRSASTRCASSRPLRARAVPWMARRRARSSRRSRRRSSLIGSEGVKAAMPRTLEEEGRHPPVPVRTVALEPEQQGGAGAWSVRLSAPGGHAQHHHKTRPWVFQLGSEVTRSTCRTPQAAREPLYYSSSCCP